MLVPYRPQENSQVERKNKILCTTLDRIVKVIEKIRDKNSFSVLYRCTYKTWMGTSPFDLSCGFDVIFPNDLLIPAM